MKQCGPLNIGKWQKPVLRVYPTCCLASTLQNFISSKETLSSCSDPETLSSELARLPKTEQQGWWYPNHYPIRCTRSCTIQLNGHKRPRVISMTIHHTRQKVRLRQSRDIQTIICGKNTTRQHPLAHSYTTVSNEIAFTGTYIVPIIPWNFIPKGIQVKLLGTWYLSLIHIWRCRRRG